MHPFSGWRDRGAEHRGHPPTATQPGRRQAGARTRVPVTGDLLTPSASLLGPSSTWSGPMAGTPRSTLRARSESRVTPFPCSVPSHTPPRPRPERQALQDTDLVPVVHRCAPSARIPVGTTSPLITPPFTHPRRRRMLLPRWVWPDSGGPWTRPGGEERPREKPSGVTAVPITQPRAWLPAQQAGTERGEGMLERPPRCLIQLLV